MTDLKATLSTNEDLIASLDESPVLMSEMSDIMVAGVTSWNGASGDVTYTAPVTSVNGQTGDVTVASPTKTSELTNDSGFITSADVPTKTSQLQNDSGFLTQAVTSFNGQSGAVTYNAPVQSVNGQTGAVTVNVPTKTSQLQNDSSYITSAQAPVQSVNGQTGVVTITVPEKTTARADGNYLYNGQTVEAGIANAGFSTVNNLLNNGYNVAIRSNASNPFLGLLQGTNRWYAQAANGYFYFGPTSTNALRLDQSGNGVFQTGSVTAQSIIKSGGTSSQFLKADGSVDNNTYLTSAPVTSVNGRTGAVTVTEGLTPLVGLYTNITPTQVLTALQEGRTITLTYIDNTYGPLTFNYFIYAMGMNLVFAQTIIHIVGGAYSATINGDLTTDTWTMTMGHLMYHSSLSVGYGSVPNVTNAGSADTWAFVYDDSTEEITISGTNGTAPTLGTNIQVLTSVSLQED